MDMDEDEPRELYELSAAGLPLQGSTKPGSDTAVRVECPRGSAQAGSCLPAGVGSTVDPSPSLQMFTHTYSETSGSC